MDRKSLLSQWEMTALRAAITILVIMLVIVVVFFVARVLNYNSAIQLLQEKRYAESAERFEALGEYRASEAFKYFCFMLDDLDPPKSDALRKAYNNSRRCIAAKGYDELCELLPPLEALMEQIAEQYRLYELSEKQHSDTQNPTPEAKVEAEAPKNGNNVRGSFYIPDGPAQYPSKKSNANNKSEDDQSKDDDPYDASSYYQPEDFYEDHWDDFYDFEDAEDYWYDHS